MTASVAPSSFGEAQALGPDASDGSRLLDELLVAAGGHDEAAFAQLYELTSPWIYYLLRRRARSTADPEGELVRVYTAVWQRAASFTPPHQSALAWVTNIAYDVTGS